MNGNVSEGFPGNILLLFTMLIWSLFLLVYFSNRQNRSNQWCAIAGLCFSMGVLKEYIYFTLDPVLISRFSFYNADLSYMLYSVLTGVLYYFALPCSIMFSFYFNGFHLRHPNIFSWLRYLIFVALVFAFGSLHYQLTLLFMWLISSFIAFYSYKKLVFITQGNHLQEYLKSISVWILSYFINAGILSLLVDKLMFNLYLAQGIAISFLLITNYLLFKHFAFSRPHKLSWWEKLLSMFDIIKINPN